MYMVRPLPDTHPLPALAPPAPANVPSCSRTLAWVQWAWAPCVLAVAWQLPEKIVVVASGADVPAAAQGLALLAWLLAKGLPLAYAISLWQAWEARQRPGANREAWAWGLGLPLAWVGLLAGTWGLLLTCAWACHRVAQVLV